MENDSNLISANELHSRIGDSDLRIIDCRFDLAERDAGRRAYLEAHIPGAVFADLDQDLAAPISAQTGRHPLPSVADFAATLGRLGIGNGSNVVAYDAASGSLAARAWWMLRWVGHERVRVLDGGIEHWTASALPVASGAKEVPATRFQPQPRDGLVLTTAELESDLDGIPGRRLYDARDPARFRGEIEPIDPVAGHIPGTMNLPFGVSVNTDGRWKSSADLQALWRSVLGENKDGRWAVMCGSGVTACHLALSALQAGYREPRLYVGSWSEWITDPERPIARGEARNAGSEGADSA